MTRAPVRPSLSRLRSIVRRASRSFSTKTALAAPRESASRPIAPEPAKRSSTVAPSTGPIRLKAASRTRSAVGRVSCPFGATIFVPRFSPAMILNGPATLCAIRRLLQPRPDSRRTRSSRPPRHRGQWQERAHDEARDGRRNPSATHRTNPSCGQIVLGEEALDLVVQRAVVVDKLIGHFAGLLQQIAVGSQASEPEVGETGLPRSQQLALSAQLQIHLRELEAVGGRHERLQTRLGRLGQLLAPP